jgi:hypothetical protein
MVCLISSVSVGEHLYWGFNGYTFHGEVLLISWAVFLLTVALVVTSSYAADKIFLNELHWYGPWHYYTVLSIWVTENVESFSPATNPAPYPGKGSKTRTGGADALDSKRTGRQEGGREEENKRSAAYSADQILAVNRPWVATLLSAWSYASFGALTSGFTRLNSWAQLESGELAPPTVNPNVALAFASLTCLSYFYAGLNSSGYRFFLRYLPGKKSEIVWLGPLQGLLLAVEEVAKPTAITCRLFGVALADEVLIAVLLSLTGALVPIPIQLIEAMSGALCLRGYLYLTSVYIGEAERSEYLCISEDQNF